LTIALGIGATTVMFTVVNGVLLKPLPYRDAGHLLNLQERTDWSTPYGNLWAFSYPNFFDCKRQSHSVEMAALHYAGGMVTAPGHADYVDSFEVSAELFSVLGVRLSRGRAFRPEEDRPGGTPVAVISYGMWQQRFAGNPAAVGMQLVFGGRHYTVVGVLAAEFRLDGDDVHLLTPIGQDRSPILLNRDAHGIGVWARLRPGVNLQQANEELAVIGHRLAKLYPESNRGRVFTAEALRPQVGDARSTLWLLFGAVSLVLLIACANIASLLLARAVSRERELAMRAALGAGRGRLIRQCLTESAVLSFAGGAVGIVLAVLGIHPFERFWPGSLPRVENVRLDWHVLLFALSLSLLCGLFFGLAPAFRAPARKLEQTLRSGARMTTSGLRRLQTSLVITEIALAVLLLISAGMLARTLLYLSSREPGVNIRNVLIARVALSPATLADPGRTRAAWQNLLEHVRHVPGVQSTAIVDTVPMREGNNQIHYWTSAAPPPKDKQPLAIATSVTPDYLKVMGLPLRRGRFFSDHDRMKTEPVVVIDEVMAQQAFGSEEAVGKHVWINLALNTAPEPALVIGVVGHVRHWGLAGDDEAPVRAQLYYPFAQVPDKVVRRWSELMSVAVRTSIEPSIEVEALRRELRRAGSDQVLYEIRTLAQLASATLARQRFLLFLFGLFASLALLLACVGIYGVLAYLTNRRVPELGVRMALGATASELMWIVLRQSLWMIFVGVAIGSSAAVAVGHLLRSFVQGMQPADPSTFGIMIAILTVAALMASFLPARHASRTEPMRALRQE
jgi:predicted permease